MSLGGRDVSIITSYNNNRKMNTMGGKPKRATRGQKNNNSCEHHNQAWHL